MVTGTVTGQKLKIYCTILVTPNRPKLTANTPFASVCLQVLDRFFLISVRRFLQAFASVYKRLRSFTSIFLVQRSRDNINERFSNAACAVCFGQLVPRQLERYCVPTRSRFINERITLKSCFLAHARNRVK